ncbi:MAG: hypothetical protein LAO05_14535 [Acidobacteriia bacterium]|nr:hypothetical protein [Terriglobia bacterium]
MRPAAVEGTIETHTRGSDTPDFESSPIPPSQARQAAAARRFALTKWYFDCVEEDGTAFIGYSARLVYRGTGVSYASVLLRDPNGRVQTRTSLRRTASPSATGSTVSWNHGPLAVAGTWQAAALPVSRALLEYHGGAVSWNCAQPLSRARVQVGSHRPVSGWGYAELLEITIPPWQLPFDHLRWGHFMADGGAMVWIQWQGEGDATWVFVDGAETAPATVDDGRVKGRGLDLRLDRCCVLREGSVGSTALGRGTVLARLLPLSILRTFERKWLSRGFLQRGASPPIAGWAIHEDVAFGKGSVP